VHLVEVDAVQPEAAQGRVERRVRWRADRPELLGASPVGKRPFVASTTASVTSAGRWANHRPMISSETPAE